MMATDHSLILRRGIIAYLKANVGLVALVPASHIYGEQPPAKPTWPFIRFGLANVTMGRFNCYSGGDHGFAIHAFSMGPGTDEIYRIRAAIISAMDDASIPLDGDAGVTLLRHDISNLIRDTDEADAYHDIHQFKASVFEKA